MAAAGCGSKDSASIDIGVVNIKIKSLLNANDYAGIADCMGIKTVKTEEEIIEAIMESYKTKLSLLTAIPEDQRSESICSKIKGVKVHLKLMEERIYFH